MARPRRRKALVDKDANAGSTADPHSQDDAPQPPERADLAAEVCIAIDREVEARAAAIRAIRDAQTSAVLSQLRLQEASFSDDVLDMPIEEFVQRYCPNTQLVRKEGGVVAMQKKDAASDEKNCEEEQACLAFFPPNASKSVKELFLQSATKQFRVGLTPPKTVRLPNQGEALVSINGSPLGSYSNTAFVPLPDTAGSKQSPRGLRSGNNNNNNNNNSKSCTPRVLRSRFLADATGSTKSGTALMVICPHSTTSN